MVEEDLPEKLKKAAVRGESEANLRGHLRGDGEVDGQKRKSGSSSYVPEERNKDNQLQFGLDLLRGIKSAKTGRQSQDFRKLAVSVSSFLRPATGPDQHWVTVRRSTR